MEKRLVNSIKVNRESGTALTFTAPHIFVKYIVKRKEYDVYKREKYLANILKKFNWFPELLYCDDINEFFIYRNVGVPFTKENKPKDLEKQFNRILNDLQSVNVQHNDIDPGELLIDKNKKIYLCDFGWGSVNNDIGCGIGIWGCHNKKKPGGYRDDKTTLKRLGLI